MTQPAQKKDPIVAERERVNAIRSMGERHNLPKEMVESAIRAGTSTGAFGPAVLEHLEARQNGVVATPVGMSEKELANYSLAGAIRSAVGGENSLEREVSSQLRQDFPNTQVRGARSIHIPLEIIGRATAAAQGRAVSVTTGTAQHTVPQTHGTWQNFLTSKLALARAGLKVLTGLRGDLDLPAGDEIGTAGMPGENASQADSEATFKNVRLSPKPLRSRATFSRTLLNNSVPAADALIEEILQTRTATALEAQIFRGTGSPALSGIDGLSGVGAADFASGTVTYEAFYNMLTVIDNAKGLIGDPAFITTMGVCAKGMTTSRFGGDGFMGILQRERGMPLDEYHLDGVPVYRSHEVKRTYAQDSSPSTLTAHGIYCGVWNACYLGIFGALELVVDQFGDAANGNVIMWSYLDCDFKVPHAAVLSRADNVVI